MVNSYVRCLILLQNMQKSKVDTMRSNWDRAVKRSFGWAIQDVSSDTYEESESKNKTAGKTSKIFLSAGLSFLVGIGVCYGVCRWMNRGQQ